MTAFPEPPDDDYAVLYRKDTDKALPEKIVQSTRYAYFKTIARGGKSIIQSCRDLHLGRTVCYKKLRPEFEDDPIEQRRLLREARVSAMLQHPNTVPTYELSRDLQGRYFFTMKLVHGYTLREVLDFRERYDLRQLIDVVIQVSYALQYAHSHGVIHRDIKPDNVLVGPYGEVLLLDWGLAKVWDETVEHDDTPGAGPDDLSGPVGTDTSTGQLQGTISYMSPEQIRRDPGIDYRSDIYSLGVMLYEILSGRLPAPGETVEEVIEQIHNVDPPWPSEIVNPKPPRLLETVAMRCIAKTPDERLQNWSELIRLLQEDWGVSHWRPH
ncbi:MAG: serine/threonine-protein kinase [Gammaproteobacteria bacterium]|jgi:serine/threonine-protein kinase